MKGMWSLPGGILETGEKLADGCRREVLEETGLHVDPYRAFEIFERIMLDSSGAPEYHYVLIDFLCRITAGEPTPGDDVARTEWVRREDLGLYVITEGTVPVVEKAFDALR